MFFFIANQSKTVLVFLAITPQMFILFDNRFKTRQNRAYFLTGYITKDDRCFSVFATREACHPERKAQPNVCKKCHLLTLQQKAKYFLELNNTNTVPQRQLRTRKGDTKCWDLY